MQAIFQRMDEFVPEAKKVLKDKTTSRVDKAVIEEFKKARTFDEKMALLQKNKDLGNQYIDKQRTGGPKELAFALIQNNAATQKIMAESKDAVLPFKEAGKFFRAETDKIAAAVPNLAIQKRADAKVEQAITGDATQLLATARANWESIWSGNDKNPAVPLSGWDYGKYLGAEAEMVLSKATGATERGLGRPLNDAELMVVQVRKLLAAERQNGNVVAEDALKAQLQALLDIVKEIQNLNARVAGAPPPAVGRPNPVRPAPAARAPAVP
jgi:hypothetical protein